MSMLNHTNPLDSMIRAQGRRSVLRAGLALGGASLASAALSTAQAATAADAPTSAAPSGLTAAPTSMVGSSPRLTLHAIDTFHGATGAGLAVLSRFEDGRWL